MEETDSGTGLHQISNDFTGQSKADLWFGIKDGVWDYGKLSAWRGVLYDARHEPSDPYLINGFDKWSSHLVNHTIKSVDLATELNHFGKGGIFEYNRINLGPKKYIHHEFHWGYSQRMKLSIKW